ncbi:OLC1v1012633C1 [Oldenlandia corymbosa var. corymbosa]|uniref:E3 ubiquitin-protein ligase RMA n=1 Tax=Oldenlandia corymbosa var. corymbosa TaxID=529605 RepID=A0AAV1DZS3_OLDCO|nr:OLC1v1012633C1 [Oldenlandia corymbosa var. corymbosa]
MEDQTTRRLTEESTETSVNKALGKEKQSADPDAEGSCFDCSICFDEAKDPVVTHCGHLFCWRCIYEWLSFRNSVQDPSKECPVCKMKVSKNSLTPIYGKLSGEKNNNDDDDDPTLPPRPQANRVPTWKDAFQQAVFSVPRNKIPHRFGRKMEMNPASAQSIALFSSQVMPDGSNPLLNWVLTSKGMRRQQNYVIPPNDANDVNSPYPQTAEESYTNSTIFPGSNSNGAGNFSYINPSVGSGFPNNPADMILGNPGQELDFLGVEYVSNDFSCFYDDHDDMNLDQIMESFDDDGFIVSDIEDDEWFKSLKVEEVR